MTVALFADDVRRHDGRYYGKYRGQVVDDADEGFEGSLKVTVPSVFGPDATVTARACMPYGHFYVPPKGAHVFVEFEAGDPELPLWVGCWYPAADTPGEAKVSPPEHRVIQTAAGHTIEFVDHAGDERILIRHSTDAFLSIDKDGSVLLSNPKGSHIHLDAHGGKATFVEQHGNYLTMTADGTSIVNPSGTLVDVNGDTVHVSAAKIVLDGTTVAAGTHAMDSTVLGMGLQALWTLLVTHVHGSAMGPTTPSPQLAAVPTLLPGTHLTTATLVK